MRPLCICKQRPAAINYYKDGKAYYRKLCERCLRNGIGHGVPKWKQSGYEKKDYCEKCNFKSQHPEQFNVFHIDGDLQNCRPSNLKTILQIASVLPKRRDCGGNKVTFDLTFKILNCTVII